MLKRIPDKKICKAVCGEGAKYKPLGCMGCKPSLYYKELDAQLVSCEAQLQKILAEERRVAQQQLLIEMRAQWCFDKAHGRAVFSMRLSDWAKLALDKGITESWWELEALKGGELPEEMGK